MDVVCLTRTIVPIVQEGVRNRREFHLTSCIEHDESSSCEQEEKRVDEDAENESGNESSDDDREDYESAHFLFRRFCLEAGMLRRHMVAKIGKAARTAGTDAIPGTRVKSGNLTFGCRHGFLQAFNRLV